MRQIEVTQLEKVVLEALAKEMYAEPGFSDAGLQEVVDNSGLSVNVVRGVQSSLLKKNLIEIWDRQGDMGVNCKDPYTHIWYLGADVMGLVTEWIEEGECEAVTLVVK